MPLLTLFEEVMSECQAWYFCSVAALGVRLCGGRVREGVRIGIEGGFGVGKS